MAVSVPASRRGGHVGLVQAVVITDNRLRRLRNGIYHKYNRKEIAGNAECRHLSSNGWMNTWLPTNIMQAIATRTRGGGQSAHIANVAAHQLHAFPAHLNGVKAQC